MCLYVFNIFKQWFAYFNRKLTLYYQKNCFLNNKKVIFWYFLVDSEGIYLLPKIQITLRSNKKSVWKHQFSEKDKIHQKKTTKNWEKSKKCWSIKMSPSLLLILWCFIIKRLFWNNKIVIFVLNLSWFWRHFFVVSRLTLLVVDWKM